MPEVLLVEDNQELSTMLRMLLELEGMKVEVAADGKAAREWLDGHRPSVVLLDWMLPDMNGDAVAERIKEVHGDVIPIVLFTADGNRVEKAERIGAYASITKPFTLEQVVDTVHRAIDGSQRGTGP